MELLIKGKNVEITEAIEEYIQQRLGKLEHHLANITSVRVELSEEKTRSQESRYVAQVTIDRRDTLLRGEERAGDLFAAIDGVANVIIRQIQRYKGKLYGRKRPSPLRAEIAIEEEEEEPSKVVKIKRFPVKPMSVDEAIDQMELLGHDFFLFFNPDAAQFNLLYRRKDGNYGLIQPELD
jgi:putative sigma-54 modulation protein